MVLGLEVLSLKIIKTKFDNKKSRIFFVVGNAYFSGGTLKHLLKKVLNFKKKMDCNLHQHVWFQANIFLSDNITHLNQVYLFIHVARASL